MTQAADPFLGLKDEAAGMGIFYTVFASPIGTILLMGDEHGLFRVSFMDSLPEDAGSSHPILDQAVEWLKAYFEGRRPSADEISLSLKGTPFMRSVWRYTRQIPYGETATYGKIAQALGSSPRAVGRAVGSNPVCLFVPCHRALGAGGKLTGYAAGIERKEWLLKHEGATFRPQRKRADK